LRMRTLIGETSLLPRGSVVTWGHTANGCRVATLEANSAMDSDAKQLKYLLGRGIESPSDVG